MKQTDGFTYSTPEKQGVPSEAILSFLEEVNKQHIEIKGLILMRNQQIIAEGYWEPYTSGHWQRLYSAGKALVSTAILFAIQEGYMQMTDKLVDLLPDCVPEHVDENLKKVTIYHLLTMTAGHGEDFFFELLNSDRNRAEIFCEKKFVYEPGTHFLYDNAVPDVLAILLYRVTGQNLFEYLDSRLFQPLGMTGIHGEKYGNLIEPVSMCAGTRDLLKLTMLYAQKGEWNGRRILCEELAVAATSCQVPSIQSPQPSFLSYDTQFGYGFQIWRNSVGGFRIDGGRGQFGIAIPELDLVAAIQSNEEDQNIIPVLFWKHIVRNLYKNPIQENPMESERLRYCLKQLSWIPMEGCKPGENLYGTYRLEKPLLGCEQITVERKENTLVLQTEGKMSEDILLITGGEWKRSKAPFLFEEITDRHPASKYTITGYQRDEVYYATSWQTPNLVELHFRGDGWMGANIITVLFQDTGLVLGYERGTSYNLRKRTDALCRHIQKGLPYIDRKRVKAVRTEG